MFIAEDRRALVEKLGDAIKESYEGAFIKDIRYEIVENRQFVRVIYDDLTTNRINVTNLGGIRLIKKVVDELRQ